ncbi:MAG: Na(+)/H(+) antiporter subunit D [Bacteroidota bacterium]|nr:Na(+)/H(+) antiporter subunit D [Bacteroidota bacterium]
MISIIHPSLLMIAGAILIPLFPKVFRSAIFIIASLAGLIILWTLPEGNYLTLSFLGNNLILLKVDALSKIFAAIFAIITVMGGVYAYHLKDAVQQTAALIYSASAIGVTFAGDFITLFISWELMAAASLVLIWSRKDKASEKAGMRYLVVHLFGGSLLLTGIILHISETGSILVEHLLSKSSVANWFIIAGFGLNAAIPPLNAWLPDAYPKATVTGAVFLSALTTKTAVYALARVFAGWEVLLILGTIMTVYGVIYAVLSNDIRELLSYHIISQVGYMVAGVGIGTMMGVNGSTAHAFSHILYKGLLFMGAGVLIHATGRSKLSELGGLAKFLPITLVLYLVGGFSISGVPLFNGFISKSMVVYAAGDIHNYLAVILMNIAMVGTFLSTTLKLPYLAWFNKEKPDAEMKLNPIPINMHIGMGLTAFLCVLFGAAPSLLYQYLPYQVSYEPYTGAHLVETAQILLLTFFGFWIFRKKLAAEPLISLDFDWFYRRPKNIIKRMLVDGVLSVFDKTDKVLMKVVNTLIYFVKNPSNAIAYLTMQEPSGKNLDYDPNISRPTTLLIISGVLLVFVIIIAVVVT